MTNNTNIFTTSFPGFSPTRLTERVGENSGNEVDIFIVDIQLHSDCPRRHGALLLLL